MLPCRALSSCARLQMILFSHVPLRLSATSWRSPPSPFPTDPHLALTSGNAQKSATSERDSQPPRVKPSPRLRPQAVSSASVDSQATPNAKPATRRRTRTAAAGAASGAPVADMPVTGGSAVTAEGATVTGPAVSAGKAPAGAQAEGEGEEAQGARGGGAIHVITGPMFAGKTTALLERMHEEMGRGRSVLVVKSKADTRYARDAVVSHDGAAMPCLAVRSLLEILAEDGAHRDAYEQAAVIGVDEAQFIHGLVEFSLRAADHDGKTLFIAGLDGDFRRKRFGELLDLIPHADSVTKLAARCEMCGRPASFTLRKTQETKLRLCFLSTSTTSLVPARQAFSTPTMAIQDGSASGDDDDAVPHAKTGLDFLLSSLALEKVARSTPDTIPLPKEAAPAVLNPPDTTETMDEEPTVGSAPQPVVKPPATAAARNVRLKQATLSFGKTSAMVVVENNVAGPSERPRPRLNIDMNQLIADVYEDAHNKFKSQWSARFPWLVLMKTSCGLPGFKCSVCEAHAGDAGKCGRRGKGATDVQTQSFCKHAGTQKHKLAMTKFTALKECGTRQPLIDQLRVTGDGEKLRVESLLDSLLFVSKCDAPMGLWVKLVRYLAEKGVKGFPKKGYGTYYTTYGFGELTQATATWLQTTHLEHVLTSPFIGISLDESTDRCSGKHMIMYVTFIRDSKVATEFMTLITVDKGDAATLVGLLVSLLQAVSIDLRRISGISTDGANVMMGSKSGLVTHLRLRIPHLVSSHCIAHSLELQGIHVVRWLSWGDAVLRFIAVLPGLIVMLKEWDADLYALLDYAGVYGQIRRTISHIESRYVDSGDDFCGGVSERLSPFLARHGSGGNREVTVEGVDSDERPTRFKFKLHEDEVEYFEGPATHDGCVEVCTTFAEKIVFELESRLGDLEGMAGAKLFTPDEYPLDRGERLAGCLQWLSSLVTLFKADKSDLNPACKNDRSFHAGLTAMLKTPDWRENYPNLVQLWVAVAVLPLSTVECERGFSRQNIIKSWQRGAMKDARLGDLMCMSLMQYQPK
ncbi:unnamed protein product [Closterium sp. NIES-54]